MMTALVGVKGVSAWLVYNKVAFYLPFIQENRAGSRRFSEELAAAVSLETVDELRAFILGLNVNTIPQPMSQAACIAAFKAKGTDARKMALLECLTFADLTDDEVVRLLAVHSDANGIPYSRANMGNIALSELTPMLLETLLAASMIDVDLSLVTGTELSTLDGKRLDVKAEAADILTRAPAMGVGELLSLAIKNCFKGVNRG